MRKPNIYMILTKGFDAIKHATVLLNARMLGHLIFKAVVFHLFLFYAKYHVISLAQV